MSDTKFSLYAIRHKPTGAFMPMRWDTRRGYSHDEPNDVSAVPRLFRTEKAAKLALRAWLAGKFTRHETQTYYGEYDEIIDVTPVASRNAADMEIVRMVLAPA